MLIRSFIETSRVTTCFWEWTVLSSSVRSHFCMPTLWFLRVETDRGVMFSTKMLIVVRRKIFELCLHTWFSENQTHHIWFGLAVRSEQLSSCEPKLDNYKETAK